MYACISFIQVKAVARKNVAVWPVVPTWGHTNHWGGVCGKISMRRRVCKISTPSDDHNPPLSVKFNGSKKAFFSFFLFL